MAENIKKDVAIFGVTGTHEGVGGVPKTGQTTSYRTGDDGDLEKGVVWPTPRFTDHEDGTVTDNLTRLMWTKNANLPGRTGNWNDALDYCRALDHGGYTDWRLPNVRELLSLIDRGRFSPALPSGHPFTGVQSDYYWSSTTYAFYTARAWYVGLGIGTVSHGYKSNADYVWPVRAGQ